MPSKLDQLKTMTTVVADTGDMEAIRAFKPTDATTNPTLILKASQMDAYAHLVEEAVVWGRSHRALSSKVVDRLAINFGEELTKIVPGRVSTEVDADLSFDTAATVAKARAVIAEYERRGVGRERILIKIASTWEGIRAAEILQKEGIDCNLTLLDWHVKNEGKTYTAETDPGVLSVRKIFAYYKTHGVKTVVMGASFRNQGEIEALAGCDRLTISPQLLESLDKDQGALARALDPAALRAEAPAKMSLDEKSVGWLMNEDAMAGDKLAEGIRAFAKDLRTLQEVVSKKLEDSARA